MPMSFPPEISLPPLDVVSANALPDLPRKVRGKKRHGYQCTKCNQTFPTSQALNQHKREKHELSCSFCGKEFVSKVRLTRHMLVAHSECTQIKGTESDEFKEIKSEPSAQTSENLDEVEAQPFEDGGLPDFVCGVCGKTWRRMNEDLYRNHLEKAHGPFVCLIPGCRKVFAQWGGLYRHKTEVHAKKRSFQCGICKKQFKRRYVCVKHMCSLHGFNANTQRQQILQLILRPEIVSGFTPATRMPRMRVPNSYVPPRRFPPSPRPPLLPPAPEPVVRRRYFAIRTGGRPGKKRKKIQSLASYTISPF